MIRAAMICQVIVSLKMITESSTPQNGELEKISWLRVAPICCADVIYKTMLKP